jgi:butyryl-CoA dehydrogenase
MYNLQLSPEQLEIRDTVRDFVTEEVKPLALRPERLEARARPLLSDVLDKASQLGLRTLALSEDAGGAGADTLTSCIVTEELALGDPDVAAVLARTSTLAHALFDRLMTPEQTARFLPPFLADDRYHLALAQLEPDRDAALGIHYHRPETSEADVKTTAVRAGDAWVINGVKDRVANAPLAGLFAVEVNSGPGGTSMLLVPRDAAGLSVRESDHSRHFHHGVCGELVFTDCQVPAENLLGAEREDALGGADAGRDAPLDQALNLGIGRAAYEAALEYAQLRVQGGRRIIEHQAIGTKLADCTIKLELARNAIWKAAWLLDHPEAVADRSASGLPYHVIARVYTAEAVNEVALLSAECFGAMGVMRDMPLQKYVHDSMVFLHNDDADGAAKLAVAEAVAGYARPEAA